MVLPNEIIKLINEYKKNMERDQKKVLTMMNGIVYKNIKNI